MERATARRHRLRGLDLKVARIGRGITQRDVAAQLQVSSQRVSAIEAAYRPTPQVCRRYLAGLDGAAAATGTVRGESTSARDPAS